MAMMHKWFVYPRLERAAHWLWGLVLLTLPVTTFRYVPGPLGRTLISPLAIYPLALLVIIMATIFLQKKRLPLPANFKPLLAFLLFALAASFFGLVNEPLTLRGASFEERVLRGWFSLFVGLLFFFSAFWMNRDEQDLRRSLKWIYAGLALTLLWSLVQAIAINTSVIPRALVNQIQLFFSTRPIPNRRIIGFAYEPAWLADQIVILYLPWLFAAIIARRSLTGRKWLEPALFLISVVVLVFTYSRGGLFSALLSMTLVTLLTGRASLRRIFHWFTSPFRQEARAGRAGPALFLRLAIIGSLFLGFLLVVNFLSRYQYFASIWELGDEQRPLDYIVDISAGPRLAYALAGFKVYENAPLTGVGIGASGLSLLKYYPEWSLAIPEISRQLIPDSNLIPNIKSFYVRLLAEMGLPGFWLFIVFLLSFLAMIRRMFVSPQPYLRFVAIAGFFGWLGLVLRNLTQDSFTFPIMWVILGLIAGLYPYHPKEFHFGK